MTGEEMERAIEFLLKNQATHDERIERMQAQIGEMQTQLSKTVESISELNRVVQMQATSQGALNEMLTRAVTSLAEGQGRLTEAQTKTEAKVDRLADIVERLVERLGA